MIKCSRKRKHPGKNIIVALDTISYHNSIMKMRNLKQTYIIFTASDQVYCTAESYDLANEIIEADGLIDAVVQQVNHITNIKEGVPVTISYENTSTYDCTTDDVNDVCHKSHY